MPNELPQVELYTDGGCSGNPGPGGWAFILRHTASKKEMEASGGEPETTNNRMELTALVRGLEALKMPSIVMLYADSVYVGKGFSEWMPKWKANGWRRREGSQWKEVKNEDLWRRLDELSKLHQLKFIQVAGHSGHVENDRVDELAVAAYQQYLKRDLPPVLIAPPDRYNRGMASAPDKTNRVDLNTGVQFLKGCGAARAEMLARLGVFTVRDLLFLFPRDYQDLTDLRNIDDLEEGPIQSVLGTIEEIDFRDRGGGRSITGILLKQDKSYLRTLWFDLAFMKDKYRRGQQVLVSGKAKQHVGRWQMVHPHLKLIETEADIPAGQLLPVYPLTEGLGVRPVRRLVQAAIEYCVDSLEEVFPEAYLAEHSLLPLRTALPQLHAPSDRASLELARRRFIYQELLMLQLALALKRQRVHDLAEAPPLELSAKIDARIRRLLPFELTAAQNQAIAEIAVDLARPHPMNRLLQGDVGSGKTIVAVYAMLLAVAHGAQAILMAPTEILARQHLETLGRLLAGSQVRLGLLTGSLSAAKRRQLVAELASGEVQILIGTQALVDTEFDFAKLALVVIDEQHKFGVRQRASLKQAGPQPHYLVMTATPIPRTVGMTLFGDLDVTTLRDSPPGRQTVHTYLPPAEDYGRWWEFYRKKLREGRQGYVITPLVDGSDEIQTASLEESFEALANGELEAFRLGLVHGRMSPAQKEAAMLAFRSGETQVLMATSIVEVGVDVSNATLMAIQGAERFGLAQLHQLRGRISRGMFPGYCCLFAENPSPEARRRLEALVASTDGFELAEIDFALRGPGDLLGTRQHGLPPLRIADLARDAEVLEEARRDAQSLVAADPGLAKPEHAALRRMALVRYGQALDLGDVG